MKTGTLMFLGSLAGLLAMLLLIPMWIGTLNGMAWLVYSSAAAAIALAVVCGVCILWAMFREVQP